MSTTAITVYGVLMSVIFVGYLLFITYFLMFKAHVAVVVNKNFENVKLYERINVERWLGCKGDDCNEAVVMIAENYLQQLVVICCIIVGCQVRI